MSNLDKIITRQYSNFMGVDFSGGEVPYYHSPDALNMWRDYTDSSCIQTRPGLTLLNKFDNVVNGLFFYKINDIIQVLLHIGTKLVKWNNYPNTPAQLTELYTGLSSAKSKSFIFDNVFFLIDGVNYIEYNGTTAKEVEGTIPYTTYQRNPDGSTNIDAGVDTDYVLQPVNCLTSKRYNQFIADGTSTAYQLDDKGLDSNFSVRASIHDNGSTTIIVEGNGLSVDRTNGVVTFTTAPSKDASVDILFSKTISNHKSRILNCNLLCEFDNRLFFAGNEDYPNSVFWGMLNDPRYVADINYNEIGLDVARIKAIIPGNNVLWVVKENNQNGAGVYYLTPTLSSDYDQKIYPVTNGNVSTGCVSTGINYGDYIVYYSNQGLECISSSALYSEQILQHKSTYVDARLLKEQGYENPVLAEYKGYLLTLVNSKIYLADNRKLMNTGNGNSEFEWFYWELPNDITNMVEYRDELYLMNDSGYLYLLDGDVDETTGQEDSELDITSYWTTRKDDFGCPSYTKTTSKKGGVVNFKNMDNDDIIIQTIPDGVIKDSKTLSDEKGYAPFKIKDKKFYKMQLKFSSNKPFGIYSAVLQGFIAGYVKR